MENDLISRSALNEDLRAYADRKHINGQTELANGILKAISRVKAAPAVDAVEVVRCKDCEHYGWGQDPCHGRTQHFCRLHKGLVCVTKDSFCSYGERRSE